MVKDDITIPVALAEAHPHQTWQECPQCRRTWAAAVPSPGVLYREQVCETCAEPLSDGLRLEGAARDVAMAAADLAVLTLSARNVSACLALATEAERLAAILQSQADAARWKAGTL